MKCISCDKPARKRGYCNSHYTVLLRNGSIKRKFEKDLLLTDLQKEFIIGSLLGDGWITNLKYGRKSPAFGIDRKQDDLEYLKWQFSFVENLCSRDIVLKDKYNKTTKKTQKHCSFETRFLPSLLEFRKLWYPNDKKIVPNDLSLSRLIMQIWYCDDGTIEKYDNGNFRIKFATNGFTKDEVIYLIDLLEDRYNSEFSLNKDENNFRIVATTKTAPILMEDLLVDAPPMVRKFLV